MLSVTAACADTGTGPTGSNLIIAETQAAVDEVVQKFFTDNAGVQSLTELQSLIATALPSLAPSTAALSTESTQLHGVQASMAIPTELLGRTFEYDTTTSGYQPTERTGAPVDGIRFILYSDISSLNEIGYFDLVDKSDFALSPATIDVTLDLTITDVGDVLSYRITGSLEGTDGALLVDGFLSDGADQLVFDFAVSGSESSGFDGDLELSMGDLSLARDFHEETTATTIEAEITDGPNEIVFVLIANEGGDVQEGSGVWLDDTLVAFFSGNLQTDTVSITDSEGVTLKQAELLGLAEIFVAFDWASMVTESLIGLGLDLIEVQFFF
jgi:hypothetical protein